MRGVFIQNSLSKNRPRVALQAILCSRVRWRIIRQSLRLFPSFLQKKLLEPTGRCVDALFCLS